MLTNRDDGVICTFAGADGKPESFAGGSTGRPQYTLRWRECSGRIRQQFKRSRFFGMAMMDTDHTDAGDGRVNVSFMLRW